MDTAIIVCLCLDTFLQIYFMFFSNYEPPWSKAVGTQGDLFYLQAEETIQYVPSTIADKNHIQNGHTTVNGSDHKGKKSKKRSKKKDDVKIIDGNVNHVNSNKVTFNDIPTGVTRDVMVFVDPNRNNFGRRATQCESLLGIIPGHFNTPSQEMGDVRYNKDKRIMVQGLLPGGEAVRAAVKIGQDFIFKLSIHIILIITHTKHTPILYL